MEKNITIYDLAKQLKVSPATVSRSLNDHPSISAQTKKRIVRYAQQSGYRSNRFAVNLSTQRSHTLGVIVPRLNSYFMSTVLAGIEQVANEHGYTLIISQSLESVAKEKLNAKTLFDSGVDALLISLAYETIDYKHLMAFIDRKIPLLFFDRVFDLPNCPAIVIDNRAAGLEATEHLIAQGCKNLLHISGNLKRNVYRERFLGFKEALVAHGLSYVSTSLLELDLDIKSIDRALEHVKNMKEAVDGIFVANDTFAVHLMKALMREGYLVPNDIKVVGFNNDPVSEVISPNLTTIDYPGHTMGALAGQSIIGQLNGTINLRSANSITIKHTLIERGSSAK